MLAITVDSRFPFAVSPECCSCPCFSNGVVSLTLRKRSHRKIVSHSAGHSIFNRQNKKPIHRNIKNQREFFSRFKMMFYVTALKFKDGTVCSSVHSQTVPKSIECRRRYFLLAYRRHYPAHSRHPKSVKKDIQLSLSFLNYFTIHLNTSVC